MPPHSDAIESNNKVLRMWESAKKYWDRKGEKVPGY
jgi:hypothetical protein